MFTFLLLQTADAQTLQDAATATKETPWMEIAQIAVPVATTIVTTIIAGLVLAKRNEKYKNELVQDTERFKNDLSKETEKLKTDLAKDIHRYQTLHPKRFDMIQTTMRQIAQINSELELALTISSSPWDYQGDVERQTQDLDPVAQRVSTEIRALQADLEGEKFIFDEATFARLEETVEIMSDACSAFLTHHNEEDDTSHIPALTPNGLAAVQGLITGDIPAARKDLEETTRKLLFAA